MFKKELIQGQMIEREDRDCYGYICNIPRSTLLKSIHNSNFYNEVLYLIVQDLATNLKNELKEDLEKMFDKKKLLKNIYKAVDKEVDQIILNQVKRIKKESK